MMSRKSLGVKCSPAKHELEAERPASTDEGAQEKLQQLHCLEEEVGLMMRDVLPCGYTVASIACNFCWVLLSLL